jgi:N-acetylglutamate synthase-like GNAT family acetyltransferase
MNIQEEMKMIHELQLSGEWANPKTFFFTQDNTTIIIKSTKEYLISYSDLVNEKDYCYLRMVYVPIENRRKGLGTSIINWLIDECKKHNVRSIELESEVESFEFFKNLNFQKMENEEECRMKLIF